MTQRLTISRAILIFGLVTALGLGAVIATSVYGLSQLKVGGPLYNQIKLGNDLDRRHPAAARIRHRSLSRGDAGAARSGAVGGASRQDRQLKKEYDERREFWVKSDLDPVLKTKLVEKSDGEVRRFWTAIQDRPAARARQGRQRRGGEILCRNRRALCGAPRHHRRHRQADQRPERGDGSRERRSASARSRMMLWGVSAVVFLIIGAGIFGVAFGVIRPIAEMTAVMKGLAGGDLDVSVPRSAAATKSAPWRARSRSSRRTRSAFSRWNRSRPA